MLPASNRLQNISFYLLLAVVGLTVVMMFLPFFTLIALGGILAVLFYPIKIKLLKHIKSETLASLITLGLALLIIIIPIYLIGQLVFNEIVNVYNQSKQGGLALSQSQVLMHLPAAARPLVENFFNSAGEKIGGFAGNAFASITGLIKNIGGFVIGVVFALFTFYYFLKDGDKFHEFISGVLPLSHTHETLLIEKLESAINGVVRGSFTLALLQGGVSTIGFYIFGVPQPLLWGVFTVLASLVPTVGTLVSLVPAILLLFLSGHVGAGVGMTIWAFLSIQSIDNFINPRLIGYKTHTHPILAFLSILGGLSLFGYLGFLIGPIIMSMFVALLELYAAGLKTEVKS